MVLDRSARDGEARLEAHANKGREAEKMCRGSKSLCLWGLHEVKVTREIVQSEGGEGEGVLGEPAATAVREGKMQEKVRAQLTRSVD